MSGRATVRAQFASRERLINVETLNAQQEAKAGIAAGEELSNRQVRALRELWLMPAKDDKPPMSASPEPEPVKMQAPLDVVAAVGQLRAKWGVRT